MIEKTPALHSAKPCRTGVVRLIQHIPLFAVLTPEVLSRIRSGSFRETNSDMPFVEAHPTESPADGWAEHDTVFDAGGYRCDRSLAWLRFEDNKLFDGIISTAPNLSEQSTISIGC